MLFCDICKIKNCAERMGNEKEYPKECPSCRAEIEDFVKKYETDEETLKIARASAVSSMNHNESRVQQTVCFARKCGYQKLGIAFCITLAEEARELGIFLRREGFEVESVICKVGHYDRRLIGIEDARGKPMCNPIAQAEYLNQSGCELNIVLGLCVGHDSLFIRYSDAPVTVLAAKDHVYDNAPMDFFKKNDGKRTGERVQRE